MEKYLIVKDVVKQVRRFNMTGRTLEFKLRPIPLDADPVTWIKDAVNQVIARGTEDLSSGDQVAFSFCSKDFRRGEGWVRFRPVEQVTYEDVWDVISNVYQSNSTGLDTSTFCLGVTTVKMPAGRGRGRSYNTFVEECAKRRGIVTINNKDNLCLPRALVVAAAYAKKDPEYNKIRKDTGNLQTQRALELCRDAGVVVPEGGGGIPELQVFQKYLGDYKIVVYQYGRKGRDVIFKGAGDYPTLNLLYHEGHYNVVTSLTAAFSCEYYCEQCQVPYDHKNRHRCGGTCSCCQQSPSCLKDIVKVKCDACLRFFRGPRCYDNHKKPHGNTSVCSEIRRCELCFKTVKTNRKHTCGEVFCKICQRHQPEGHLCYMQPDTGKPKTTDFLFIFYDLETRQEKEMEDGSLLHEPNLCVFKQCCDTCIDTNKLICEKCGVRLQTLKCDKPIPPFVHHVLNIRKKFKQVVVIAHNGGGFDHQFILNHILTQTDLKPELIMRGTKLISMAVENVKFLDSLNYFPMALAKLPKAFGLNELKKGYFPHLFNTTENSTYKGPLPAIEFYDLDNLTEDGRNSLLKWHSQKVDENYIFDFEKEFVDYCVSDVEILAAACLKFRQQLLATGNVCPFTEACTIASACNKVYRRNFLKPNTIGIIPKNGYRWRDNQSKIAIQWLVWEEHQRGVCIVTAAKEKECVVQGVKVDGYCPETKQIFEFHGCYYHGCLSCFKYNRDEPVRDDPSQTLNTRFEATTGKTDRLRELGYDLIEMWECEFRRQLQQNGELRAYTEKHPLVINTPLNPRDAFYGGRTGNTRQYYKCGPGEKIKYVDVCSLYPWVCKYGKFPIGHPKVSVGQECSILQNTDGLIKCKILPPQGLYHPVLPTKMNNKLMFVLCRTCGEQMMQGHCPHDDDERALIGTWVIDEVLKAVEKGYEILEIYEIWSYQTEQFEKAKKTGGLFTEMMNKFIRVKQQASGWPSNCSSREEKEKYIEMFLHREDVQLEFKDIVENPGLRSLAKLMLNSFWGKLGQRENQPKTKIIRAPEEFFSMLSNPSVVVNSVFPVNEDTLVVNYEHRDEASDSLATVNVVIAAYVTTQARLKLYSYLELLGNRVLYYDTDSIIYVSRDGEFDVPTGEFLGDMTDELEGYGKGSYIETLASGGPKNYTFRVWSTKNSEYKTVCKVKGISLTYTASQIVNFETIKNMILTPSEDPVYITSKNIRRTAEHKVVTKTETKVYRPNSMKRQFQGDYDSLPYGYKRQKTV